MSRSTLVRRLPHVVWLLLVWVSLWGEASFANLLSGVLVVGLVSWFFVDAGPRPASPVRPRAILEFIGFFSASLAASTAGVARAVLSGQDLSPGVISFGMRDVSDAVVTLVANSITLTPGTMTLDVRYDGDDAILFVHVFDLADEVAVRADLQRMMGYAVLAFGDRAAVEHVQGVAA